MVDFFSNLLTRNNEVVPAAGPALRPRPITLFEPAPNSQFAGDPVETAENYTARLVPGSPAETAALASLDWLVAWRSRQAVVDRQLAPPALPRPARHLATGAPAPQVRETTVPLGPGDP
jgi:hypothetical protein